MANRHLSRSIALQSLFEWDFAGYPDQRLPQILERVTAEFGPGLDDDRFVRTLVLGIAERREKLDLIIEKAAPEWPIPQIAIVDRNVLRLGLFELLFADKKEGPARVAINEAIELAKSFGGENSGRFVNGVLGAVYKEMGEPGKDDVPAKKKRLKDVPYDEMSIEKLGGAVVYCREGQEIFLALEHDIFGYWTLPKGHLEDGEEVAKGAERKVREELGIAVVVGEPLGANEYVASDPEKGKIRKQVNYFLAAAKGKDRLKLEEGKGGLDEVRWFTLAEIPDLRMYDDVVPFITKAIKKLIAATK